MLTASRAPGAEGGGLRPPRAVAMGAGRGRAQLVAADMAARRTEGQITAHMERLKISE